MTLLNSARESAKKRVDRANSRMAWFGGPEYAQRVGAKIFKGEAPDAKTIKDTLAKMVSILGGKSLRFDGATCADPLCESKDQHAVAYESGATEPVTVSQVFPALLFAKAATHDHSRSGPSCRDRHRPGRYETLLRRKGLRRTVSGRNERRSVDALHRLYWRTIDQTQTCFFSRRECRAEGG